MKTIEEQVLELSNDVDFLKKLEALTLYFDASCGICPEHSLEGYTIFNFAKNPISDPRDYESPNDFKDYIIKMKQIITDSKIENKDNWFWIWDQQS